MYYLRRQLFLEQGPSIVIVHWFDMVPPVGGTHVLDEAFIPGGDDDSAPRVRMCGLDGWILEDASPGLVTPHVVQHQQELAPGRGPA
jgi:hypothetical protein